MDNHCHLFLLGFILIGVVGQPLEKMPTTNAYKKNSQTSLINVNENSKGAEGNSRTSRIVRKFEKFNDFKTKNGDNMEQEHLVTFDTNKAVEHFGIKRVTLNSVKLPKILQVLQENLSLSKLKLIANFLEVYTIVLYGFSETIFKFGQVFTESHPPLLIIRDTTVHWNLKDLFNSNILSIVFLGVKYPLGDQLLANLKQSLKGGHLNKLIFIKDTFNRTEDTDVNYQLFNWLHANGFWQSLLMDYAGNSMALQHLTGTFLWNLSLEEFLLQSNKWPNLQGYAINCSMASNPPRAHIQYDNQHKVILKGYYGTIISLFVQHYNATLKPFILSNLDYYTEWDCVKYIRDNKVDICGDALPFQDDYVVSYPDEIAPSYLMVPHDKALPRFYYFLKPFQLNTWTLVTCSFFYKVITLSLIHRLQHGSWNASLQILYATLSVLYLPFQLNHIKGRFRRFLEIIMILVGFVVANWYLSVLSSLLFSRLYFHNIKTLQHLVDHNISIMVDDFEQYLLNISKIDSIIMLQLKVVSNEVLLQHRRNLDPHYAYYSQYDKIEFYLHQQKFLLHPRMKVLMGIPPINEVMGGIPMSPNWPFQHLLNDFIRRILESGLYLRIYVNSMEEGVSSGYLHYFPTEHHHVEPLSIEYFQMPAMLLAVGYTLSFASFLLELLVFKRISNK